ncbi:MAG TPA: TolC family protein [Chthoniobacterales bacterium]
MTLRILALFAAGLVSLASARALTLEEALARSLENNPRIQEAKAGLEAAAGQRLVFRSVALPVAGIDALAGAQGGKRAGQSSIQPFAFAQGDLRQPLFRAEIPASLRRGEMETLLAAQQLNVAVVEQLHQARTAFYAALYERSLEELGRSQRQRLDENVTSEEARYQAGSTDRSALVSATLLARELDPQIDETRRAYGAALLQLAAAMGNDLAAGASLPKPQGTLDFEPVAFPETETAAALQRRPDVRLARLLVRAAREDERISAAGYYPRIDLTLFGRYIPATNLRQASSGTATRSDDIVSSEVAAGAAYTWRVIDNGKVGGAVLQERALRDINELQLQKLEASVGRELAALRNNFRAIAARHTSLSDAVAAAEKNVAVVEKSRQEGFSSQLDFRTAEAGLLATRRGILSAAYEQQIALAEWDRATGRYFQFSEPAAKVHIADP